MEYYVTVLATYKFTNKKKAKKFEKEVRAEGWDTYFGVEKDSGSNTYYANKVTQPKRNRGTRSSGSK
jgi:hypothetical protein